MVGASHTFCHFLDGVLLLVAFLSDTEQENVPLIAIVLRQWIFIIQWKMFGVDIVTRQFRFVFILVRFQKLRSAKNNAMNKNGSSLRMTNDEYSLLFATRRLNFWTVGCVHEILLIFFDILQNFIQIVVHIVVELLHFRFKLQRMQHFDVA